MTMRLIFKYYAELTCVIKDLVLVVDNMMESLTIVDGLCVLVLICRDICILIGLAIRL